ncbi:MAG: hypothetical protein K8T90_06455 [Planctomycetes bacterium]|nr:hypothetical protein [Planctomycetota bacterium]
MTDTAFEGAAPHADPSQFDLVIEAAGPDTAIAVVHRMMGASVLAYCAPEDVWQEALALAWRDREQHAWIDVSNYRRWLLAIARNRVRDIARSISREKRGGGAKHELFSEMGSPSGTSLSQMLPPGSVTPSRVAGARERSRIVLDALAALPDDVEPVLRLHLLEEKPMEEVAAELSIGVSAAWHRYRRGAALYAQRLRALRSVSSAPRPE